MRAVFCFLISFVFPIAPAFPAPPQQEPWLQEVQEREPELAGILADANKDLPSWEDFQGRPYADVEKATEKVLSDVRSSFDAKKLDIVVERLRTGFSAAPPDWALVGLALKTAYFAKSVPAALQIAESIVKAPPAVEFGDALVGDSMRLLVASGRIQYRQLVFDCAYDEKYLKAQRFKPAVIASAAVNALGTLPAAEARPYLEKLAQKYPYDPKVSGSWSHDMPERQISSAIASSRAYVDAILGGKLVDLGPTRP